MMKLQAVSKGKHTFYLSPHELEQSLYYTFSTLPLWVWSVSFTKISVLLMLLRIKQTPVWKRGITIFIGFVVLNGIAITLVQLLQCRPIQANWDISYPRSACMLQTSILNSTYVITCESLRIVALRR